MKIHANVSHLQGTLSVALQAQYAGDTTDADDKAKISAYGDPKVNLGGTFSDPKDPQFTFSTGSPVVLVDLMGVMCITPAYFVTSLPTPDPGKPITGQGPTQIITSDPVRAATIWRDSIVERIRVVLGTLRARPNPIAKLDDIDHV